MKSRIFALLIIVPFFTISAIQAEGENGNPECWPECDMAFQMALEKCSGPDAQMEEECFHEVS